MHVKNARKGIKDGESLVKIYNHVTVDVSFYSISYLPFLGCHIVKTPFPKYGVRNYSKAYELQHTQGSIHDCMYLFSSVLVHVCA